MMRKITTNCLIAVPLLLSMVLVGCFEFLAGGTEIENPEQPTTIAGRLIYQDGTPSAGANVSIRPVLSLADTTGLGLAKKTVLSSPPENGKAFADTTFSTITDDDGAYSVDTGVLDPGVYVIEGNDGEGNLVLIDSVVVVDETSAVPVAEDTLKPAGALKGVITLSEGGDPRKVFVLAFGIDRFAAVNADGSFKFENLAKSEYDLRIISILDDYGVLDLAGVNVTSGDTTDLDTLELPFEGISVVKGLSLSYDTLLQIVTLTWDRADTALVAGYNVYRTHLDGNGVADSNAVLISPALVRDTVYRDSTGVQDEQYSYQVAAVDGNGNEGRLSGGTSATIEGIYSLIDSIGVDNLIQPVDINSRIDGRIFVTDDTIGFKIFSSNGMYQSTIPCSSFSSIGLKRVFKMDEDSQGNLYVTGVKDAVFGGNGVILKISPQDSLLSAFGYVGDSDSILGTPGGISVVDTLVFVENTDDRKIKVYSTTSGTFLYSIGEAGTDTGQFVEIKGMDITNQQELVVAEETRVQIFDLAGTVQTSFDINLGVPGDLKIDSDNSILIVSLSQSKMHGLDFGGRFLKRFQFDNKGPASMHIDSQNNLYIRNAGLAFFEKYHRK